MSVRKELTITDAESTRFFTKMRWDAPVTRHVRMDSVRAHRYVKLQKRGKAGLLHGVFDHLEDGYPITANRPLQVILEAMLLWANAVKSIFALQMSGDLGLRFKTAFALPHKIRRTLSHAKDTTLLVGDVEFHGGSMHTTCGLITQKDRPNRTRAENPNPDNCFMLLCFVS